MLCLCRYHVLRNLFIGKKNQLDGFRLVLDRVKIAASVCFVWAYVQIWAVRSSTLPILSEPSTFMKQSGSTDALISAQELKTAARLNGFKVQNGVVERLFECVLGG